MRTKETLRKQLQTLDDVAVLSPVANISVGLLRREMISDPGHDEAHIVRVVRYALWFASYETVAGDVLLPAAILHDLVNLRKDSPQRSQASRLSADKAVDELKKRISTLSDETFDGIHHAILTHSWSAGIAPLTDAAKSLQDADRMDSLGAIGISRLFAVGGALNRDLFHPTDPLAKHRPLDEIKYTLDHYFVKLKKLKDHAQTLRGKGEARMLTERMERFVNDLMSEI